MRVRDDHGAWARAPSTDTADPDAYTHAGDAAGIPPVGPPGTGARAQGSRKGRQAPTPGCEGAPEGEPSRGAHPAPAVEGGSDGAAGGRSGRGHSAPDRRLSQLERLRGGAGRCRVGATAEPRRAVSIKCWASGYAGRPPLVLVVRFSTWA